MNGPLPSQFPYHEVALKMAVTLGIGLLVGLEREWAQKEIGVRTFAIVAITGTLAALLGTPYAIAAMVGVFLLVAVLNAQSLMKDGSLEMTTSAALMVILVLGIMVGMGNYFAAVTGTVLVTMLLAWKFELSKLADALLPTEIRSAVLLGLLSFVVYPLLPNRFLTHLNLINPQKVWLIVIVIAGIGFVNYVLLRLYGRRGLTWAAVLGGLVNSNVAGLELASSLMNMGKTLVGTAVAVFMLTKIAAFIRNLIVLAIFSPEASARAAVPMIAMMVVTGIGVWLQLKRNGNETTAEPMKLDSPLSLRRVFKFTILFVLLIAGGTLAQRYFKDWGFLVFSVLGGLVSSASTTATAAELTRSGQITPQVAALGTVITSISSTLLTIPIVYQETKSMKLTVRLLIFSAIVVTIGMAVGVAMGIG